MSLSKIVHLYVAISLLGIVTINELAGAQENDEYIAHLAKLDVEDLLNQEITTVSRKEQKLSEAAAAVFVITQEDIRRSGANSIPEVLRMAPGLHVARIDSNQWAISARGFNGLFANKLLVLIDGRTVYTPLFAGVYWDVQDYLLEDIERIEIIRGPGATLWGSNAVNGIINIITKQAKHTTGIVARAGAGTEERVFGGARYGTEIGPGNFLRFYSNGAKRDDFERSDHGENFDDWESLQSGFRFDSEYSPQEEFSLHGDIYDGSKHQAVSLPSPMTPFETRDERTSTMEGGNLVAYWGKKFSETAELKIQGYFDRELRNDALIGQRRNTYDIEIQHRFEPAEQHDLLWGVAYRYIDDIITPGFAVVLPIQRSYDRVSAFVQDDFQLVPDRFVITAGSKFEYNDFSGFEIQPSVRGMWRTSPTTSLWAAVSRAVRSPSRASDGVILDADAFPGQAGMPTLFRILGDPDGDSEKLLAYELGYRFQTLERLNVDISTFYNRYNNLTNIETEAPFFELAPAPPHLVLPARVQNGAEGDSMGIELATTLGLTDSWRIQGSYTYFDFDFDTTTLDPLGRSIEGENPHNLFTLRSLLGLTDTLELDSMLRYVDNIPSLDVESYADLDLRLGWHIKRNLEVSLVGQNLLHNSHGEYVSTIISTPRANVERAFFGKVVWRF